MNWFVRWFGAIRIRQGVVSIRLLWIIRDVIVSPALEGRLFAILEDGRWYRMGAIAPKD